MTNNRPPTDVAAREAAVDPRRNIVLEASAGTGKTRVLVTRYINLIRQNVDPSNILAITFTRKAAAEMRQRVVEELRKSAALSPEDAARWRLLRDRLGEIAVCTIDAFCLLLLREFPLEADLDPDFEIADESEMSRLVEESLDSTLRIARSFARTDESVGLLFAQLGETRLRAGLSELLGRRLVAADVLKRVLSRGPRDLTIDGVCTTGRSRLLDALRGGSGGLDAFLEGGPVGHPRFAMLAASLRAAASGKPAEPSRLRGLMDQLSAHVLTQAGKPRSRLPDIYTKEFFVNETARKEHRKVVTAVAPQVVEAIRAVRRDLNAILSRAVWRVFQVAINRHRSILESHGVLDFGELLARATALLNQMDEFARSRFLLEARYHHLLVDEFQDTSRAQWNLVETLVRAWGEGAGLADEAPLRPSIFIVGDRKQSIYGFRDAEVRVLTEAADAIRSLRADEEPLRSISHSFRSAPELLAFANDLFAEVTKEPERPDAFRYDAQDAFPLDSQDPSSLDAQDPSFRDARPGTRGAEASEPALGVIACEDAASCAIAVAQEVARLVATGSVSEGQSRVQRPVRPGDIAILFRSRASHREFERALEALNIRSYVYKGLGFFDADEIKDVVAIIRYLADPTSNLRAAALLRSRLIRLSDPALQRLAPNIASALSDLNEPAVIAGLDSEDREIVRLARSSISGWLNLADRVPPAELLDTILADTAYAFELRGAGVAQARENVKKIRGMIRRIQNRGYLTLARLSADLDQLGVGDESNAAVDAVDAVNLMTIHAAKGLERPIVFVVNMARGTRGGHGFIRIAPGEDDDSAVAVGDYRTEYDEDAGDRDKEETKRLLYVAVTRARNRLYLSSIVQNGALKAGPRSLASVIPESFRKVMELAATSGPDIPDVEWQATSGRRHRFIRCHSGLVVAERPQPGPAEVRPGDALVAEAIQDFDPISDASVITRVSVTDVVRTPGAVDWSPATGGDRDALIAGRLVHRMFQFGVDPGDRPAALLQAGGLLDDEERDSVEDPETIVGRALAVYERMRCRPDVHAVLDGATCYYEVPVSFSVAGAADIAGPTKSFSVAGAADIAGPTKPEAKAAHIVRGVIDCVACQAGGEIVVVDFKTGAPRETDQRQLDLYVDAARQLYPDAPVRGVVIYPG